MPHQIKQWSDIAEGYSDTIILGNGASVAVNSRFSYASLLGHAREKGLVSADVQLIFDFFKTNDFELVLRAVWQTSNVNSALEIADARTKEAYVNVRDALIQAVQDIHPERDAVSEHFPAIAGFLSGFKTVLSLNYDLIVYWTMMHHLDNQGSHAFKDCFLNGTLDDDWVRLREPLRRGGTVTLVFYLHGNLILCRNKLEQERKIHGGEAGLLHAILARWKGETVIPVFVSEGTSEQKVTSIRNSYYLSTVYREVLRADHPTVTIYGWNVGEHDAHILERLKDSNVQRVAISVYQNNQELCNRASHLVTDKLGANVQVDFFDSASAGCWINPKAAA